MRRAIDNWSVAEPVLKRIALNGSENSVELSKVNLKAPLPRAADFIDGSGYLSHIERVRKARGADLPKDLETNPLMYRGIPTFLDPLGSVSVGNFADGVDCEAELAVIVGDVPAGATPAEALRSVLLLTQINDISLRYRIKAELPSQFGFLTGKPPSSAGPFAVTLDELAATWNDGRPQFQMRVERNGQEMGDLDTSELHFSIGELIAHAAQTHGLGAGTVIGTGTISNRDESRGVACIAEQVALDAIAGRAQTAFFQEGEEVTIEAKLGNRLIFGRIKNLFVSKR
jgi:fumarylacetoacetate (FAA) hydrolase